MDTIPFWPLMVAPMPWLMGAEFAVPLVSTGRPAAWATFPSGASVRVSAQSAEAPHVSTERHGDFERSAFNRTQLSPAKPSIVETTQLFFIIDLSLKRKTEPATFFTTIRTPDFYLDVRISDKCPDLHTDKLIMPEFSSCSQRNRMFYPPRYTFFSKRFSFMFYAGNLR